MSELVPSTCVSDVPNSSVCDVPSPSACGCQPITNHDLESTQRDIDGTRLG